MKKTLLIILFGTLPLLAQASGSHGAGHDMGHDMDKAEHKMEHQHGSGNMAGMSHDSHEADAGRPGDPAKVSRTVEVIMEDSMRFKPGQLKFKAGETVRFVVRNKGKIQHEMVIGSMKELKEHSAMMRKNPEMKHAESNMISLAPGEQGDVIWQFDKPGSFDFACLVPGHLEAGMTGKIQVR